MEEYRNITVEPYSKAYKVSDQGNVFSLKSKRVISGEVENRRQRVTLSHNGVIYREFVYRLVAMAFPEICGEWFEGCVVDHKNGDPTDNRAENLLVTDYKGNVNNPVTREKWLKKVQSEEFRAMFRGKTHNVPEEARKRISNGLKGIKRSESTLKKMSDAMCGRFLGEKSPCSTQVGYYKDDGTLVKYYGYSEAERETGISRYRITHSAKTGKKCKEGIQWILL